VAIVVLALAFFAETADLPGCSPKTFKTVADKPYWFAFLAGYCRHNGPTPATTHLPIPIEETKNAGERPLGNISFRGRLWPVRLPDARFGNTGDQRLNATAAATTPFIYIFKQALGGASLTLCLDRHFGDVVLWLSASLSTSRMVLRLLLATMACRYPGTGLASAGVSARQRRRVVASVLAFLLVCLISGTVPGFARAKPGSKPFGFPRLSGSHPVSARSVSISLRYSFVAQIVGDPAGRLTSRANGPWNLGNWTVAVNVIALVWIAFIYGAVRPAAK